MFDLSKTQNQGEQLKGFLFVFVFPLSLAAIRWKQQDWVRGSKKDQPSKKGIWRKTRKKVVGLSLSLGALSGLVKRIIDETLSGPSRFACSSLVVELRRSERLSKAQTHVAPVAYFSPPTTSSSLSLFRRPYICPSPFTIILLSSIPHFSSLVKRPARFDISRHPPGPVTVTH